MQRHGDGFAGLPYPAFTREAGKLAKLAALDHRRPARRLRQEASRPSAAASGRISGAGRFLKDARPGTLAVAVEPAESPIISQRLVRATAGGRVPVVEIKQISAYSCRGMNGVVQLNVVQ